VNCEIYDWPGSSIRATAYQLRYARFSFSIPWKEWDISGIVVVLDAKIVISKLTIEPDSESSLPLGGIMSPTLKFPLGRMRSDIERTVIDNMADWSPELERRITKQKLQTELLDILIEDAEHQLGNVHLGRRPYPHDELRAIARLYLELQNRQGVQRIAESMAKTLGTTLSTINKKIRRATEEGYLGPAQQGRGGRLPGPNLNRNAP
jgi:hypothetical protein